MKKGISCSGQGLRCRLSSHMVEKPTRSISGIKGGSPRPYPNTDSRASSTILAPHQKRNVRRSYHWVNDDKAHQKDGIKRESPHLKSQGSQTPPPSTDDQPSSVPVEQTASESSESTSLVTTKPPLRLAPSEILHPQARMLYEHCR